MNNRSTGGMSVLSVLQIIFIVLKCINMIDWSWWAVFIPFYIGIALSIIVCVIEILWITKFTKQN